MKISKDGIELIKKFEGLRLISYKCSAGVWTIGYGHTAKVKEGMKITQTEAEEFLKKDLERFEKAVENLGLKLKQCQFDALVSFTFNCGAKNLQTLCKNRTPGQIADALLLYNKAGGKELKGLTNRRKAERELFLKQNMEQNSSQFKKETEEKLPFKVKAKCNLNIRCGAGAKFGRIRLANKGEILTVWAIHTNGKVKWGKNGEEYFCLSYCEKLS